MLLFRLDKTHQANPIYGGFVPLFFVSGTNHWKVIIHPAYTLEDRPYSVQG